MTADKGTQKKIERIEKMTLFLPMDSKYKGQGINSYNDLLFASICISDPIILIKGESKGRHYTNKWRF